MDIAIVAIVSGVWLAYDHRHLLVALGHERSNEIDLTNSFRLGRVDMFKACSAKL